MANRYPNEPVEPNPNFFQYLARALRQGTIHPNPPIPLENQPLDAPPPTPTGEAVTEDEKRRLQKRLKEQLLNQ